MSTLVIVNPSAGSGRAGRIWARLEPLAYQELGDLVVAITERPEQVTEQLALAQAGGITRVIAVGGDGTSHAIINALLQAPNPNMIFGQIPIGTGQDFARTLKIPAEPDDAVRWLNRATVQPIDVGQINFDTHQHYFLNIASAGVSGEVDRRVTGVRRYPWTFWLAAVRSFLTYQPPRVRVLLDGVVWYEGKVWLIAVANGAIFGRGMHIAPQAQVNDGLFDVVLVKDQSRLVAVQAFNTVYSGKHLLRDEVELRRGKVVEVESLDEIALPLDLDGEPNSGKSLRFEIKPAALQMLY